MRQQHRVIDECLWRSVIVRQLHFVIDLVYVPVAILADIHPHAQCVAIKLLCKVSTTVHFLWNQMMKSQRPESSAARTATVAQTTCTTFYYNFRLLHPAARLARHIQIPSPVYVANRLAD
jgi:hypothetical protein